MTERGGGCLASLLSFLAVAVLVVPVLAVMFLGRYITGAKKKESK